MGQIVKTEKAGEVVLKSSIELAKKEFPEVGAIYFYSYNSNYIRLTIETERGFEYECYDFNENQWHKSDRVIGHDSLRDYYKRIVGVDFDDDVFATLNHYADRLMTGEDIAAELQQTVMEGKFDENTSALALSGTKETIIQYNDKLHAALEYVENVQQIVMARIADKKRLMEKYIDKMNGVVSVIRKEVEKVMKIITILEIYTGIGEEIFQITSGRPSNDKTLNVRQLTLYMDEEMADWQDKYEQKFYEKGGADYRDIEIFDNWLVNPKNRDKVIPEERCIVFFKPRRLNKQYSSDRYENELLNQWNHETYVLIRNGANLYRIYSKNIAVSELVLPKKKELDQLLLEMQDSSSFKQKWASEKMDNLNYQATKTACLVNSLCERTQIFGDVRYDMFNMESTGINIIYDGDPDRQIISGRPRFREWLKEINKDVCEGSRVLFIGAACSNDDIHYRFLRDYDKNSPNIPAIPDTGIYTIFKEVLKNWGKDKEVLYIRYKPNEPYNWKQRKNKVSFIIKPEYDLVINYDNISEEEINYYLNSRIDRPDYLTLMPVLFELRKRLIEERESEKDFVKLLASQHNISENIVWELLHDWKYKNKWKRALTADDEKAYRMIKRKINKMKNS